MLHPNRSCWLLPHPPPGVGADGQGPRQAGGQQQTLGNRGPMGSSLGPPWFQLPPFSLPGVGQWPLYSQGRWEPPLQGRGERAGRRQLSPSVITAAATTAAALPQVMRAYCIPGAQQVLHQTHPQPCSIELSPPVDKAAASCSSLVFTMLPLSKPPREACENAGSRAPPRINRLCSGALESMIYNKSHELTQMQVKQTSRGLLISSVGSGLESLLCDLRHIT